MFDNTAFNGHECVSMFHHRESGINIIIAIHDLTLGPAMGGVRMMPYASSQEALHDVLRLSKGMTAKNALANLPYGGAKAVIIADPEKDKTDELLSFFSDCINSLSGRYISGKDIGITTADIDKIKKQTPFIACASDGGAGDPSPATAFGVLHGIKAALRAKRGTDNLSGIRVAIQGYGSVGMKLAEYLRLEGALLTISDIDHKKLLNRKEGGDEIVPFDAIHTADVDVLAPCAIGGTLNSKTIPEIRASMVVGGANNQLATDEDGKRLFKQDILYAPDYVVNAGGVICIHHEGENFKHDVMMRAVSQIGLVLDGIFKTGKENKMRPEIVAEQIVNERLNK